MYVNKVITNKLGQKVIIETCLHMFANYVIEILETAQINVTLCLDLKVKA